MSDAPTDQLTGPPVTGLIGRALGKLVLVEQLGRGAAGDVYRAEQAQLGRSAVVKVLRHSELHPNRVERFLREAKLASRLDHPYAAHVYAFGVEPDGVMWIAMEHVRGATLDELIARRGPIPARVFAPLFARLCEVVHSMHELGIVHRDIKASNVMVIERSGQLLPKLIDFGIAKGLDTLDPIGDDGDDNELTAHGATLGSPHYMSPEQWRAPSEVDARADIYGLGVLGYRCLAGALPFQDAVRSKLKAAHLEQAPPPLPGDVPRGLGDAILRALAKQADARWPTALALGDAAQRAVGGVAPEAVPIFDPVTRDMWTRAGPQPIADAVAHLASAGTTVEADAALRELVAIVCRWLAILALAEKSEPNPALRDVMGRDAAAPWLALARATPVALPGLVAALVNIDALAALAERLDASSERRTLAALAVDVANAVEAMRALEPLLAYQLVVGRGGAAELWTGRRRRERERVVAWGQLDDGQVALLDAGGKVVLVLSPLAQVVAPMPSAEPELFLLWRSGRRGARLMAAPWGFERDDDAANAKLAAMSTEDVDTDTRAEGEASPYPGLAAYRTTDAARFVGREREIEQLANRLVRAPMLAVLGPSGAGKSSFVHAGVLPRLAEQHDLIALRPGRHPIAALAALPALHGADDLAARLRELGEKAPRGLVIAIDQLEELVTLCSDAAERDAFLDVLAAAAGGAVRVLATVRDDFARIVAGERWEVFVLAAPSAEALRRIVVEPARRMGVTVEPAVVDAMVAAVADRPASLPLLSFTAARLWTRREGKTITRAAYDALGGVEGALSSYADEVYGSLARGDQAQVRAVFHRLIARDGTRIPTPRGELGHARVVSHLIDARLLVVRDDDIVEVVHECLADRWDRLARWRSEDAADRGLHDAVRAAALRWKESPELLWRGDALAQARRLADLSLDERAFVTASTLHEQRARRRKRVLVGTTIAIFALATIVTTYLRFAASRSRDDADRAAGEARAAAALAEDRLTQSVIAQGRRELNDGRALPALAYFNEALKRGVDTRGLRFMIAVAERGWRDEQLVLRDRAYTAVAVPSGGIALADRDGGVTFFDDRLARGARLDLGMEAITRLRARGDRLLAIGNAKLVVLDRNRKLAAIDARSPPSTAHLGPGDDEVSSVEHDGITVYGFDGAPRRAFHFDLEHNVDGDTMFTAGSREVVFTQPVVDATGALKSTEIGVVDLRTMQRRALATDIVAGPDLSDDGALVAYIDRAFAVHLLDGQLRPVRTFHAIDNAQGLLLARGGDRVGVLTERAVAIFGLDGALQRTVAIEPGQAEVLISGDDVWTGGSDGVVRRYVRGELVASLPSHLTEITELRLAGKHLVVTASDASVVVLDPDARQLVHVPRPCAWQTYEPINRLVAYACPDARTFVYLGQRLLGAVRAQAIGGGAVVGDRVALVADHAIRVLDGGVEIAQSAAHWGPIDFEDRDHLLVGDRGVWRWTISTNAWEQVRSGTGNPAVAVVAGGILSAQEQTLYLGAHAQPLDDQVAFISTSRDRRWAAVQLATGGTVIVDGVTGAIASTLPPSDATGVAAVLDATGDLAIRPSGGYLTVWERATGDNLVFRLEMLRSVTASEIVVAAWGDDGRIELAGRDVGVLDIPRETRPTAAVQHAITCRVPLEIAGGRLEPRTVIPPGC